MKLYVGVTDGDWFRFLKEQKPDEVNFWRPSTAGGGFGAIEPGSPFLFELHCVRMEPFWRALCVGGKIG